MPVPQTERVEHTFEEPVENSHALDVLFGNIAQELSGRLLSAGLRGNTLQIVWTTEEVEQQEQTIPLNRPTSDPKRIEDVLQSWLQKNTFETGLTYLSVTLADLAPVVMKQPSLFDPTPILAGVDPLPQLAAKYGKNAFYHPALTDVHHPLATRRFRLCAYGPAYGVTHSRLLCK